MLNLSVLDYPDCADPVKTLTKRVPYFFIGSCGNRILVAWAAENRILKAQMKGRLLLSHAEKATLAEIAHRLGRNALDELAAVARPDTLLAWYRKLIANKFDGSMYRKACGRPRVDEETEHWVVRMAKEKPGRCYHLIYRTTAN